MIIFYFNPFLKKKKIILYEIIFFYKVFKAMLNKVLIENSQFQHLRVGLSFPFPALLDTKYFLPFLLGMDKITKSTTLHLSI